jgi:quercetin dioxygenase-like cupin family protein
VHIQEVRATRAGANEMFTGAVYIDEITDRDLRSRMRVNAVRFSPGARTAWHSHGLGQTLRVTEGLGRAQARGGEVITIDPATPSGHLLVSGTGMARHLTTS